MALLSSCSSEPSPQEVAIQKQAVLDSLQLAEQESASITQPAEAFPKLGRTTPSGKEVRFEENSFEAQLFQMMDAQGDLTANAPFPIPLSFRPGTAFPKDSAAFVKTISQISLIISCYPGYTFEVIGNTDPGAVNKVGIALRKRRADKIKNDLMRNGTPVGSLQTASADASYPGHADDLNTIPAVKRMPMIRVSRKN
jgi:outer membrane protein OmpA-like peptidoglycan-associated protein